MMPIAEFTEADHPVRVGKELAQSPVTFNCDTGPLAKVFDPGRGSFGALPS